MESMDYPNVDSQPGGTSSRPGQGRYRLAPLVKRWEQVLSTAKQVRKKEFDTWADEAMQFFDGPATWMWDDVQKSIRENKGGAGHGGFLASGAAMPEFKMSVNRLFEAVAMFGPALYHQNPTIAVNSRMRPEISIDSYYANNEQARELLSMVPAMEQGLIADENVMNMVLDVQEEYSRVVEDTAREQRINTDHASLLAELANYAQQEGNKRDESRMAITEAIITGMGLLEVRVETPPSGGVKVPRSRYRTVKDLLVDPDAKYWRDVTWIALRSIEPCNKVEEKFGLPPGSLKGHYARASSMKNKSAVTSPRGGDGRVAGVTHDLVEYWEVYSKNGIGQNLKVDGNDKDKKEKSEADQFIEALGGALGDFTYLAICKDVKFPLNLSPWLLNGEDHEKVLESASWEVPYWDDYATDGGWPIARLAFYNKPGKVWPISMVKPCIGELRFINWCMSFIADKVAVGSKIYVAAIKEAGESIRSQLKSGDGPFSFVELERISGKSINELISFLQAPDFSIDIWKMIAEVNEQIDKRLGLTELLYGLSSRQMRSAAEAHNRQENVNIRPDDMASQVENWLTISATREIQAYRYACGFEDVEPVLGPVAAQVFAEQILTTDVSRVTRDFTYRVVAGTARKPNKETETAKLTEFGQYFLPVAQSLADSGVVRPLNAFLKKIGGAMDMDVTEFLLTPEDQQLLSTLAMAPIEQAQQDAEIKAMAASEKGKQGASGNE